MSQKIRSLHCGLPSGLRFEDIDGRRCLSLHNVPYELEQFIFRWLRTIPAEVHSQIVFGDGYLTEVGWSAFLSWMTEALDSAQHASSFENTVIHSLKSRGEISSW